jgi:hypothetical protein
MTKITALASLAAIDDADIFYIVDDTAGTPTSTSVTAAKVAQHNTGFGSIHVDDNASTQSMSTSYADITAFNADGTTFNCTASHGTDRVTVTNAGTYQICYQVTASAGGAQDLKFQIFKNGSALAGTMARETIVASADMGSASCNAIVVLAAADYVTLRCAATTGTPAITIVDAQLTVLRVK